MAASGKLSSSREDYIEAIFRVLQEKGTVRVKDISQKLHVTKASVTGAVRSLSRTGYVKHEPYDAVVLTAKGEREAKRLVRRHKTLRDFFVSVLGVDRDEAETAACGMEHAVSEGIVDRLICFVARERRLRNDARRQPD